MQAIKNKTYAHINAGKCHWLFTSIDLPEWNEEHFLAVDVTGAIPNIGDDYIGGVFTTPAIVRVTSEELASEARLTRNNLLASLDWTQLADVSQAIKDMWAPYRQALRDITSQEGFPENVIWPAKPTA